MPHLTRAGHTLGILTRISFTGLVLMLGGMGLVFFEVQSGFLHDRMGLAGHLLSMICGTALSVWGLKDVMAHFWSRNSRRGYHFRIPMEGFAYLVMMFVMFVGSILAQSNLLLMVFCLMVGSFVVNGWLTFTMLRDARLDRNMPARTMAGETFMVTLTLENKNSWLSAWLMTLHDSIEYAGTILRPEVLFVRVPPRSHRTGAYHLCPMTRGEYVFTHLSVYTRFPLGMVERGVGRDLQQSLLVYPRLGHLRPEWRKMVQHSTELVSYSRPHSGTFQDDMHRIREFRPGDDLRMIHWKTSARMNELMVCEYQECRDRDLYLIVDAWSPARPTAEEAEEFERGLRFAATVCMHYLRSSRQSSLTVRIMGRENFDWFGDSGKQHADALLDAFALVQPSHRVDFHWIKEGVGAKWTAQFRTLIVSPRPQEIRDELMQLYSATPLDLKIIGTSPAELRDLFDDVGASREVPEFRPSPAVGEKSVLKPAVAN